MNMEELSTKTRIIVGAVACIEQDGLHSLTIRRIAGQADVNIAAVNYHFGTKANLIKEVLKSTTEEFVMLWQETADSHDTPREHLRKFCQVCMDGALQYPGVTKAHMYDPLVRSDYGSYFVKRFNELMEEMVRELKSEAPGEPLVNLKLKLVQIVAAVFFPAVVPDMFNPFLGTSFSDAETRKSYVVDLIHRYFGETTA